MQKSVVALVASFALVTPAPAAEHDIHLTGVAAPGAAWRPNLLMREQRPASGDRSYPVLYVHGATFPSATSIFFKLDGASWADSLNAAGFDVFGLDFAGYGGSERYPAMVGDARNVGAPLGRAPEAADQIERAVRRILRETGAKRVSIIAHSWGTVAAGRFAGAHPELVDRLVLFGPIGRREAPPSGEVMTPFGYITVDQQHARFVRTVPQDAAPVLVERDFPRWARTYLASDPTSADRTPPSVKTPNGPDADITDAWSGRFPYDPALIKAPVLIVRGEWDATSPEADVAWLKATMTGSPRVETETIPRATHLMHLEQGRTSLYAATNTFPSGGLTATRTAARQRSLFAVVFEVRPDPARQADYLRIAGELKPELQKVQGFLENERFRSRTRPGVLLSLSLWDNEKALVRWRSNALHHQGQAAGREGVLADYHLRVGEVTALAGGQYAGRKIGWMRRDETEVGAAKAVTVFDGAPRDLQGLAAAHPLHEETFDHLTDPNRVARLDEWASVAQAEAFARQARARLSGRSAIYAVRVIRDYGLSDRREAPQAFD